jgi:BNR repeat protein
MRVKPFLLFVIMAFALSALTSAAGTDPARLLADPTALDDPMGLPLAEGKTSVVLRAVEGEWQYNLHSYIIHHEGRFWAMWSASRADEDGRGQRIHYATSPDGHDWSEARVLTAPEVSPDGQPGLCTARGLFLLNGELTALVASMTSTAPSTDWRIKAWHGLRLVRFTWDGEGWRNDGVFLDDCMNNYPPRPIQGRLFMTCRTGAHRAMHTALADSIEGKRWTVTKLPGEEPADKMSESSWYLDPDGLVHMLFRDQRRSGFLFRSISRDGGASWPAPVRTDYPDATSKNYADRLSNGVYYLISNPGPERDPLAISFSRDGWTFGHPLALRKNAPALRYPGRAKKNHSFQYPHAMEHDGSLWVIYATNKEDIEISEFPIDVLVPKELLN